jgi:hypothetical protein
MNASPAKVSRVCATFWVVPVFGLVNAAPAASMNVR